MTTKTPTNSPMTICLGKLAASFRQRERYLWSIGSKVDGETFHRVELRQEIMDDIASALEEALKEIV